MKTNLKRHEIGHYENKRHRCEVCNNKLTSKSNLEQHVKVVHAGLKPYSFAHSSFVKVHIKAIHEKIREHNCNLCDKKFSFNTSLTMHLRSHTGEKPFKCHKCSYTSASTSHLTRHMSSLK